MLLFIALVGCSCVCLLFSLSIFNLNRCICWLSRGVLQVAFAAVDDVNTFADVVGKGMCLLCLDAHMPSFEERFVIGF